MPAPTFKNLLTTFQASSNNIDKAIVDLVEGLQLIDDHYRGVESEYAKGVYKRKATAQSKPTAKKSWANAAIIGINYLHAAHKIIATENGTYNQEQLETDIKEKVVELLSILEHATSESHALQLVNEFTNANTIPFINEKTKTKRKPQGEPEKQVRKLLGVVKDFNNFDYPNTTISTEIEVEHQGKIFIVTIEDTPIALMDDAMKDEYLGDITQKDWFQNCPEDIQPYLLQAAAKIQDAISKGHPIPTIPTQLRFYMPGLRNAYQDKLTIHPKGEPDNKETLYEGYHFGNPGHLISKGTHDNDEINKRLTLKAAHQFQFASSTFGQPAQKQTKDRRGLGPSNNITFIQTLVSPNNIANSKEDKLTQYNEEIHQSGSTIYFSNTPVNLARYTPGLPWGKSRSYSDAGIATLTTLSKLMFHEALPGPHPAIDIDIKTLKQKDVQFEKNYGQTPLEELSFLENSTNYYERRYYKQRKTDKEFNRYRGKSSKELLKSKKFNNDPDLEHQQYLLHVQIKELEGGSGLGDFIFGHNKNLELASKSKQLVSVINKRLKVENLHFNFEGRTVTQVSQGSGCASGKDRDAVTRLYTYTDVLHSYFNAKGMGKTQSYFSNLIARSGHLQRMAAGKGCTLGGFGLKSESKSAVPKNDFANVSDNLFLKTASYNKEPPLLPQAQYMHSKTYKFTRFLCYLFAGLPGIIFDVIQNVRLKQENKDPTPHINALRRRINVGHGTNDFQDTFSAIHRPITKVQPPQIEDLYAEPDPEEDQGYTSTKHIDEDQDTYKNH